MANSNGYVTKASTPPATPPDITDTIGLVCFSCLLLIFVDFDIIERTRDWKVRIGDYRGMTFARTTPGRFAKQKVLFAARKQLYLHPSIDRLLYRTHKFSYLKICENHGLLLRDTSLRSALLPVSRRTRAVGALRPVSPKAVLPPALMIPGNTCLIEVDYHFCTTW